MGNFLKRIKSEAGYMVKGAKVLPKAVYSTGKKYVSAQIAAGKKQRALELEAEQAAKADADAAYKRVLTEELRKQAILKAEARARAKVSGKGGSGGGIMAQLGAVGTRLESSDVIGYKTMQGQHKAESPRNYVFGGMEQGSQGTRSASSVIFEGFDGKAVSSSKPLRGSSVVFEGVNPQAQNRQGRRHRHRHRNRH